MTMQKSVMSRDVAVIFYNWLALQPVNEQHEIEERILGYLRRDRTVRGFIFDNVYAADCAATWHNINKLAVQKGL